MQRSWLQEGRTELLEEHSVSDMHYLGGGIGCVAVVAGNVEGGGVHL